MFSQISTFKTSTSRTIFKIQSVKNAITLNKKKYLKKIKNAFRKAKNSKALELGRRIAIKFKKPKISVIIPIYNVEEYLEVCLNSVVNQTFWDMEIICINDGSTDDSLNILNKYAKQDKRIKIINQSNKGASAARNKGLDIAKGKYIYFIDSDDFIELNTLDILYNIAEKQSCDLIIFKTRPFREETQKYFHDGYHDMGFLTPFENNLFHFSQLKGDLTEIDVTLFTKLFKRDITSNIRFKEGVIFEDNLFTFEYILNTEWIYFHNKHLHHRRVRKQSVTTSNSKNFIDSLEVSNELMNLFKKYGYYENIKEEIFMTKFKRLYARVTQIDDQYKDYFFDLIKSDTLEKKNEYDSEIDFNRIDEKSKAYYRYFMESENYGEFRENIKSYFENKKA